MYSQDLLFFGPLEKCPVCNGNLEFARTRYICSGFLSEWSSCTFSTKDPPRKQEPTKIPDSVLNSPVTHVVYSSSELNFILMLMFVPNYWSSIELSVSVACIVDKEVSGSKSPASKKCSHLGQTFYGNYDLSNRPSFSNTRMLDCQLLLITKWLALMINNM